MEATKLNPFCIFTITPCRKVRFGDVQYFYARPCLPVSRFRPFILLSSSRYSNRSPKRRLIIFPSFRFSVTFSFKYALFFSCHFEYNDWGIKKALFRLSPSFPGRDLIHVPAEHITSIPARFRKTMFTRNERLAVPFSP